MARCVRLKPWVGPDAPTHLEALCRPAAAVHSNTRVLPPDVCQRKRCAAFAAPAFLGSRQDRALCLACSSALPWTSSGPTHIAFLGPLARVHLPACLPACLPVQWELRVSPEKGWGVVWRVPVLVCMIVVAAAISVLICAVKIIRWAAPHAPPRKWSARAQLTQPGPHMSTRLSQHQKAHGCACPPT